MYSKHLVGLCSLTKLLTSWQITVTSICVRSVYLSYPEFCLAELRILVHSPDSKFTFARLARHPPDDTIILYRKYWKYRIQKSHVRKKTAAWNTHWGPDNNPRYRDVSRIIRWCLKDHVCNICMYSILSSKKWFNDSLWLSAKLFVSNYWVDT